MRKVLEGGLWPQIGLDDASVLNTKFKASRAAQARLAEKSILYDTIVLPTSDFGIVPALLAWLSLPALRASLDAGTFQLVRYPHALGYAGNGVGISGFMVAPPSDAPFCWWQHAVFGGLHQSLELQLQHGCEYLPQWEQRPLFDAILKCTTTFEIKNDDFIRNVVNQTYQDVLEDALLSTSILQFYGGNTRIQLNKLPDIGPNKMKVRGSSFETLVPLTRDPAEVILNVAALNLEIAISNAVGCSDLSTFKSATALLERRLARAGIRFDGVYQFAQLLEIPTVPDIPRAVFDGRLQLADVWKIRQSGESTSFRTWLAEAGTSDGKELARIYVDMLGDESAITHLPLKALRWAVTTGVGIFAGHQFGLPGEAVGAAISGLDMFTERWLSGYSPRFFIEDLRDLRIEPTLGQPEAHTLSTL